MRDKNYWSVKKYLFATIYSIFYEKVFYQLKYQIMETNYITHNFILYYKNSLYINIIDLK